MELLASIAVIFFGFSWYLWQGCSWILFILKVLGKPRWSTANLIWYWTKWPALIYCFIVPIYSITTDQFGPWDAFSFAVSLVVWWYWRNIGDDDDHKKLKKKLGEKVKELQGRLVVVPEPA